jgi:hypothetical protein
MLTGNPTKQEIFNFGLVEILKQGKPSINAETKSCLYRDADGNNCIVGKMLPEDFIEKNPTANGCGVGSLINRHILPEELSWMRKGDTPTFLRRLQGCHDDAALDNENNVIITDSEEFLKKFKTKMQAFAATHNLIYKEPDALPESN